ncbi:hypothetical protein Tco_0741005, partial [Tanacetum coccineum]
GTDNPGTTMEEYVWFESEKALKNGKVYNWETTKYGMVKWCLDDVDIEILRFFEPKFPAIIYNDALKLKTDLSFDPTFNHDIYLENVPSSPEYIYKDRESKAERKALRKRFSKKENFNVLNIFEDLFSCEIPLGGNLQSDKGIDGNKAGIKKFSENPPGKPCSNMIIIDLDAYFMENPQNDSWTAYNPNDEWKNMELEKDDPSQECQEGIGEYGLMINDEDYEYMCDYLLTKDAPSFMDDMDERFEEKKLSLIGTLSERIASLNNEFDNWAMANGFVKTSDNEVVELVTK